MASARGRISLDTVSERLRPTTSGRRAEPSLSGTHPCPAPPGADRDRNGQVRPSTDVINGKGHHDRTHPPSIPSHRPGGDGRYRHRRHSRAAWADGQQAASGVLTGHEALGDWTTDAPGRSPQDHDRRLPAPFDTPSANNHPQARQATRRRDAARTQGLSGLRIRQPACVTLARSSPLPMATSSSPRACPAGSRSCATPTATARPRRSRTSRRD